MKYPKFADSVYLLINKYLTCGEYSVSYLTGNHEVIKTVKLFDSDIDYILNNTSLKLLFANGGCARFAAEMRAAHKRRLDKKKASSNA